MTNKTGLSFDQTMQILDMLGAWVAGLGAFAAAGIALWLARRAEKVKLESSVGLRLIVGDHVSQECLEFSVTNIGERPVNVSSLSWCIGRWKNKRGCIMNPNHLSLNQLPKKIEYGEMASFVVDFSESRNWIQDFSRDFISKDSIDSLRARIHTSVGYTKYVKPEKELLKRLKDASSSSK